MSLILQSLSSLLYHVKQSLGLFVFFFFTLFISISALLFNQISFDSFKNFKKMLEHVNIDTKSSSNLVKILTDIHEKQINLISPIITGLSLISLLIVLFIYLKIIKNRKEEHASLHHIGESDSKIALSFALEIFLIFIMALISVVVLIFLFKSSYASLLKTINSYWLEHSLSMQLSSSEISTELLKLMSHKLTNFNGNFLISSTGMSLGPLISKELFINAAYLLISGIVASLLSFLTALLSNHNLSNNRRFIHAGKKA